MGGARGGPRPFQGGGLAWTVEAGEGEVLLVEEALRRWGELLNDPAAEVLKSNRMRTVVRFDPCRLSRGGGPAAPAPGRWILKQYRHQDWPDRVRYRFVASRAAREWLALRRLRALGFAAPRPLAYGERRVGGVPVEGGLLMEEVPQATSLLSVLVAERAAAPDRITPRSAGLLERAGALARSLHDHGVDQPDLHPENILLRAGDKGSGVLYLIDLHSARFRRRPLSRRRRKRGLAKLVHSLLHAAQPDGIRRLLAAYLGLSPSAIDASRGFEADLLGRFAGDLFRRAGRVERRRLRSRARRAEMPSTLFAVERWGGARVYRRREVPPDRLAALFAGEGERRPIKEDRGVRVSEARVGGSRFLLKERRYPLGESLRALFEGHRLRRAYRAGYALEVRGVPTPRVLALREERRLGLVRRASLVAELREGLSLERYLARELLGKPPARGETARAKRRLFLRLGELIRRLHDSGVYDQDLSPQNILVAPAAPLGAEGTPPALLVVDLDSVHLWRRLTWKRRKRNLVQAGNLPEGHVTWTDRLRALSAYDGGEDEEFLEPELLRELHQGLLREAERTLRRLLQGGG